MATARSFDLARPFVAIAPFIHEERRYAAGDAFPWQQLGVSPRKLLGLWGRFLVGNGATAPAPFEPAAGFRVLALLGAAATPRPTSDKPAKRHRAGG